MNISGLDLNLLRVFDAVYRERNATRAARRLGLSQPAVSNALGRLRAQIGDPLFHRAPEGLRPTAKGEAMAARVREALALLEEALEGPNFRPETTRKAFRIASLEYGAAVLGPRLAARLHRDAPQARLLIEAAAGRSLDRLDEGEIDLGLLIRSDPPERFVKEPLLTDQYVLLMRADHPLAALEKRSLADYLSYSHLLVSPSGEFRGVMDERLARLGVARRVGASISHFALAPDILAQTQMVLSCPGRLAGRLCAAHPLAMRPIPSPLSADAGGPISMIWRRRLGESPANDWLRQVLREETAALLRQEAQVEAGRARPCDRASLS